MVIGYIGPTHTCPHCGYVMALTGVVVPNGRCPNCRNDPGGPQTIAEGYKLEAANLREQLRVERAKRQNDV